MIFAHVGAFGATRNKIVCLFLCWLLGMKRKSDSISSPETKPVTIQGRKTFFVSQVLHEWKARNIVWDYEKNALEGKAPNKMTWKSGKKVHLICLKANCEKKCLHKWKAAIAKISSGRGCPFCCSNSIQICYCNSVEGKLLIELRKRNIIWDYAKNTEKNIDPSTLSLHSHIIANWVCLRSNCENYCLHFYTASIAHVTDGRGCPFCARGNRHVCPCNSLLGKFPQLVSDFWDFEINEQRNFHPSKFRSNSNTKVAWKCPECHHQFDRSIYDQTRREIRSCPACKHKLSLMEEKCLDALNILRDHGVIQEIMPQKTFPGLRFKRLLKFDFVTRVAMLRKMLAIEVDGGYHFYQSARGRMDSLATVLRRDFTKNNWAKSNLHLLRMSPKIPQKNYQLEVKKFIEECLIHEQESDVPHQKFIDEASYLEQYNCYISLPENVGKDLVQPNVTK